MLRFKYLEIPDCAYDDCLLINHKYSRLHSEEQKTMLTFLFQILMFLSIPILILTLLFKKNLGLTQDEITSLENNTIFLTNLKKTQDSSEKYLKYFVLF